MKNVARFSVVIVALSVVFVVPSFAQIGIFTGGGDIGNPAVAGSASVDGDVYTVEGNGSDIWGSADQMHFIYFEASGAFSFKVDDLILSPNDGDADWAKAGLMVRDNITSGSANGFALIHGNDNSLRPQVRSGQDSGTAGIDPDVEAYVFWGQIEIERIGNQINFFYSDDETGTRVLHSSAAIELEEPVLVGLAVTSHSAEGLSSTDFINPQFTQYDSAFLIGRTAPVKFPDGGSLEGVEVTLDVVVGAPDITVTETAPEGWTVENIQTSVGEATASGNVITWIVPGASGQPIMTYDATPPEGTEMGEFGESGATDGTMNAVTGGSTVAFKDQFPNDFNRLLEEGFEGLPLGPYVWESDQGPEVWTMTPPEGWSVDSTGVVGNNPTDDIGAPEWRGWAFTNYEAWNTVAGDQRRSEYILAQGTIAVCDPDEWDDRSDNGDPDASGDYATFMDTPTIDIPEGSTQVAIAFDSSWRPEDIQEALLDITFDGSNTLNVLHWDSTADSPNFHDHFPNEPLVYYIDIPTDAQNFYFTFGMPSAENDWWWAIDNIVIGTDAEQTSVANWSVF